MNGIGLFFARFSAKPAVFVGLLTIAFIAAANAQPQREKFVPNEVLVKFRTVKSTSARTHVVGKLNAVLEEELGNGDWVRIKLPKGQSVDEAIKSFSKVADIEAVQPNYYYQLQATPNDTNWGSLYGMVKISAPAAWDTRTDCSSVVVADIDTGLDYTHEDLADNVWTNPGEIANNGLDDDGNGFIDDVHGYDFRYNDPDPKDEHYHGTHTAGTIGAIGNNMMGVVGVCWNVKIMAIKIYSATANDSTSAMVINAYNYVRMMRTRGINIRVTNNSYGGCPETCGDDLAVKEGIDAMGDAGILNVFAAGNSSTNNDVAPFFPASYTSPSIVSVGGSNQTDDLIFNYGATTVDLAAPGSIIVSTIPITNPNHYAPLSGTSMSAPHVSGAVALLSAQNPSLSVASLKATLINTVDVLPAFTGYNRSNGRLNVAQALQNQTVCSFGLSSNSISVPTKGGNFSVNITGGQNCDYGIKSNAPRWIRVTSPDAMTGNGTVTFRVSVNPTISRTGTISIAGQTFTVNQSRL